MKYYLEYIPSEYAKYQPDFTLDVAHKDLFFSNSLLEILFPGEREKLYHRELALYFKQKADNHSFLTKRGRREYPYHMIRAGMWQELKPLFTFETITVLHYIFCELSVNYNMNTFFSLHAVINWDIHC